MIEVEDAVKYFGDCKTKYLRRFEEVTPEGSHIKGWICKKPNFYMGSLLIDELWGEPHEQFVQSMPKIEYFNDESNINLDEGGWDYDAVAFEKLDGSCLIIYPILDKNGKIIELVPKTRGKAVADKQFINLFDKVDKSSIWRYYGYNKGILFFELYGILNQHEIIHYQTGIDIVLIGVYDEGEFATPVKSWKVAVSNGFNLPDQMFMINSDSVKITSQKYSWYFEDTQPEDCVALTRRDAVDKIQSFLEYLNKKYNSMNNRYAVEGVVINCKDSEGRQKYIKIKPRDIQNKHCSQNSIPRSAIVKEVLKYFDDYGSEVEEIYRENENHHTEYIHRMLLEDYDEEFVRKSAKKIEKIFMDIWDAKQVPESLQKISEKLFDEYSDKGISHCMRMFAQEYPMKKKDARTVYQVLEKIFIKNRVDL